MIRNNEASGNGGGIYNNNQLIVTNTLFTSNTATFGGGIYSVTGSSTLTSCSLTSNQAVAGGAISNVGSHTATLSNCVIQSNTAPYGGGIYNDGGSSTLANSAFLNNQATSQGGAIYTTNSSSPTLTNVSFRSNTAGTGTVFYIESGIPQLINGIMFGNGVASNTIFGGTLQATFSLFEVGITGYTSAPSNLTTAVSPFASTTGVGLNACTPAINTGDNAATGLTGITTDLESNTRVFGGTVDMGAVEFQAASGPPTGLSLTATNSGTLTCAVTSLTLTASATGGTGYTFSSGATQISPTNQATVNAPGTYSVLITNANGCTALASTTVFSNTAAPTATLTPTSATLTCASPSVTLTAGGVGSYSFSTGVTTNSIVVTTDGTYSVLVTVANGCTALASTTVFSNTAAPTIPMLTASPNTTLTCAQTSITLTASAVPALPAGALNYAFSGPAGVLAGSGTTRVVSLSGLYSMTVTGSNGCTNTASLTIDSSIPSGNSNISPIASSSIVCEGSTVVVPATVISSGGGRQWYKDGLAVGGQTSATLTLGGVVAAQAGSYVLAVTGGCSSTSNAFVLTVNPLPTVTIVFPTSASVNPAGPVVTVPVGMGLNYQVFGGGSNARYERKIVIDRINGFELRTVLDNQTGIFPIDRAGLYTIIVTDAKGCSRTVTGQIVGQ